MKLFYYYDEAARQLQNAAGLDYTAAYIPVLLKNSGFTAEGLTAAALLEQKLGAGDALLLGADTLSAAQSEALAAAIDRGCTVIAFGTQTDGVFPATTATVQGEDIYATVGYFRFEGSDEPLPVFDSCADLPADAGRICGRVELRDGRVFTACVRLTERVWYWSFDLPGVLLHGADGRPTVEGKNGFDIGRVTDGLVIELDYDFSIAYADKYMLAIEDILASAGFVRVYALPWKNGAVCDMALYFAGDDDASSYDNDMNAAAAMYERGLPYHLNIMPGSVNGDFVIGREEFEKLHIQGCETAIHYNFLLFPCTEEGHRQQNALYEQVFGEVSRGPVNHCLIQAGTAGERYRQESLCGALGDNSRFQFKPNPNDINGYNLTGFSSGTAFPRFVLCDAAHDNASLDFCEVPCSFYEPRLYTDDPAEREKLNTYLEDGYTYARPLQLFTHPHYISGFFGDPMPALQALDYSVDYVRKKGWNVWLCGPDALMFWWHDRASCTITEVTDEGFTVTNPTEQTIAVMLPDGVRNATVDGQPGEVQEKMVSGRLQHLLTIVPGIVRVVYDHN